MISFRWVMIGLLTLSSCVSMPKDEQTKNLLTLPALDTSVASSLETPYFEEGEWPEASWWEMFQSPQLSALIEQSIAENPNLISVRRRIDFAEQTAKVVRSRLFPLLSFNANEKWELLSHHGLYRALNPKVPLNANLVDLTLSFNYEFDFWGKNNHLFHAALGERKAQEAEAAQVQLITTTAVAQAYFALKTNLVRQKLYGRLYEVRLQLFQLQNLLQMSALSSILPPLQAEEDLLEADQFLCSIQEEVATDQHLINILIGQGPDAPLEIDETLPLLPESLTIPSTLSVNLLARRPDLMAQIWRVEALAQEVGAAKADFYPNVNLTAFLGLESVFYAKLFQASSKAAGLLPAIYLPIFTAGAIRANIRAKKASFDEAVFQYNSLILQSVQEVADLLVLAESLFAQRQDQDQIVSAARERWEITLLRNESGLDNLLQSLVREAEMIERELGDVTLLYGQYSAAIKLVKALGGGYESNYRIPLEATNTAGEGL